MIDSSHTANILRSVDSATSRYRQIARCIHSLSVPLLTVLLSTSYASAQTVTTFIYDEQGRLIESGSDNGDVSTFEYDDANNITRATRTPTGSPSGGGSNAAPTCSHQFTTTAAAVAIFNGLTGCSDPESDTLSVVSVTDPPGAATATLNGNDINFSGIACGQTVSTIRTVQDSYGNSTTSNVSVTRPLGGWFC